ncbi:MAG: AbrB/MazE/SpoVT family DNA-binding domain-containing protein [Porticoccaceae bacterium]
METEIKRWGNSAAVRLPSKILASAQLEVASPISLKVVDGKIIIEASTEKPARRRLTLPYSEKELLEGLTPYSAHADELAALDDGESGF